MRKPWGCTWFFGDYFVVGVLVVFCDVVCVFGAFVSLFFLGCSVFCNVFR